MAAVCVKRDDRMMTLHRRRADAAFGVVLREYRLAAHFSQERLADATDLDRTYISLLERGLRQPSLPTIIAISRALGISLTAFAARIEREVAHQETSSDDGHGKHGPVSDTDRPHTDAEA